MCIKSDHWYKITTCIPPDGKTTNPFCVRLYMRYNHRSMRVVYACTTYIDISLGVRSWLHFWHIVSLAQDLTERRTQALPVDLAATGELNISLIPKHAGRRQTLFYYRMFGIPSSGDTIQPSYVCSFIFLHHLKRLPV